MHSIKFHRHPKTKTFLGAATVSFMRTGEGRRAVGELDGKIVGGCYLRAELDDQGVYDALQDIDMYHKRGVVIMSQPRLQWVLKEALFCKVDLCKLFTYLQNLQVVQLARVYPCRSPVFIKTYEVHDV